MTESTIESNLEKATIAINQLIQRLILEGVLLKPDEPLNTNFAKATVNRDFVIEICFDAKFRSISALGVRLCLDDLKNQTLNLLGSENFTCKEGIVPLSNDSENISAELYFLHN